jgi:hypothetical protein
MLKEKICLVLGAGASRPYGLPTSQDLRHIVLGGTYASSAFDRLEKGSGKNVAAQYLQLVTSWGVSRSDLEAFQSEFFKAQRVSIDAFLAQRKKQFEHVGRIAIAAAILMCENHYQLTENWYQWLLELLIRDGPDFERGKLFIISFNYDRSLEFFLWRAFRASFGLTAQKADEMLSRIGIVHVYGDVGVLSGNPDIVVPFGDTKRIGVAADSIDIAAVGKKLASAKRINEFLGGCDRICFLGFGFWKENLDVLKLERFKGSKHVFASCFGLPRTIQMDVDGRYHYVSPTRKINWGTVDQDVLKFLTHWHILK